MVLLLAVLALFCLGLPPLGWWLSGRPWGPIVSFPPEFADPGYPDFSAAVTAAYWLVAAILVAWWFRKGGARSALEAPDRTSAGAKRRFPWWGWTAAAWQLVWWGLAWTRMEWFAPLQAYTYVPLWFGFIALLNALVLARGGCPPLVARTGPFLSLFPLSAAFWWVFEFLNRFARNWVYVGVEQFGPGAYFIHATICFSTVLPAVVSMKSLLETVPRLQRFLARGPRLRSAFGGKGAGAPGSGGSAGGIARKPRRIAFGSFLLLAAAVGLLGVGAVPEWTYPLLWVGPLLVWIGLARLAGRGPVFPGLRRGDWRSTGNWALAALACGFFWETWNQYSLAKWVYDIPFLETAKIFEMPLAGYLGYLPFGLECAIVVRLATGAAFGDRLRG